jgi:hypothetical protein
MCAVRGPSVRDGVKYGGGLYPTNLAANATSRVLCEVDGVEDEESGSGRGLRGRQLEEYYETRCTCCVRLPMVPVLSTATHCTVGVLW